MLFCRFPSHLQENLENTHTHTHTHTPDCFSLKNHGKSFFLNHWFLKFNSGINRGFYFCEQSLSEEIREILLCKNEFCKNVYLPISVCNFPSMKSPVELNNLSSKFFCYITWSVISPDQTRQWTTCKGGLYAKSYCFFETMA